MNKILHDFLHMQNAVWTILFEQLFFVILRGGGGGELEQSP